MTYNFYQDGKQFVFWLRWRINKGIHISNRPKNKALFSERNGYRKIRYFLGLRFERLR